MEFEVIKDPDISYDEGNPVTFYVDGELLFKGYVFTKSRDSDQIIKTTCYDSIRYLKSNDTYQYEDLTEAELIKQICSDRNLEIGEIQDTAFKIPKRIEENQEYLNMIKVAHDITLSQTGRIFNMFDDKGKICLKASDTMIVDDSPISVHNASDFEYETSIDRGTYNRIVVYLVDDNGNQLAKEVAQDEESIRRWGVLEYTIRTNNAENAGTKAKQILEVVNRKYRSLKIRKALGNVNVRGGSIIPVDLGAIGDITLNSYMIVDKVVHFFEDGYHFMDLNVQNKDIMPLGDIANIIRDRERQIDRGALQDGDSFDITFDLNDPSSGAKTKRMMASAKSMLGNPYSQAKRGQGKYVDCSYFVWKAMKDGGYTVPSTPWSTYDMVQKGKFKRIHFSEVREGDVGVKPKSSPRSNDGHTVIAMNKTQVIHSTPPHAKYSNMGKYRNYGWYRPIG